MTNVEAIRTLLDGDPVSFAIVAYLSRNTYAMDTAPGIAEWWIRGEIGPTQDALARLLDLGVVCCRSRGTAAVYGFTPDPGLRRWLRRYLAQADHGGRESGREIVRGA